MMRRWRHHIQSLCVIAICVASIGLAWQTGWLTTAIDALKQSGTYQVTTFFDGDTLGVMMDGREEKIRMIGVDTPETHRPNTPVQCYGEAAAAFTKQLIGNQVVRLEADPTGTNRDRYDRLLRYVYLPDGRLVNKELISQGYGFAYTSFPFIKLAEFQTAQTEAEQQQRGLWGGCQVNIQQGRPQTNNAP